ESSKPVSFEKAARLGSILSKTNRAKASCFFEERLAIETRFISSPIIASPCSLERKGCSEGAQGCNARSPQEIRTRRTNPSARGHAGRIKPHLPGCINPRDFGVSCSFCSNLPFLQKSPNSGSQ